MVGTRFIQQAIAKFEANHPDTLVAMNVARHPYSWAGDDRNFEPAGKITYQTRVKENADMYKKEAQDPNTPKRIPMDVLGRVAGINFKMGDSGLEMMYHPINSQRMILWAARQGRQEDLVSELSKLHFEEVRTCADDETVLEAARRAGLDVAAAEAYLKTDENAESVWESYGRMMHDFGITGIPVFSFTCGISPFTDPRFQMGKGIQPILVSGSASPETFLKVLEGLKTGATAQEVFGTGGLTFDGKELYEADERIRKEQESAGGAGQQARL